MPENSDSRSGSSRSRRLYISECLGASGLLVALTGLNLFVFSLFPLQPLEPLWQLNLISSILTNAVPVLIGCLLMICASGFSQSDKNQAGRINFITRFASTLSLILLLLIPLQFYAGNKAIRGQTEIANTQVNQLKTVLNRLKATKTEAEFRAFVASQPNAPALPEKFDIPFPDFKQRSITNIQGRVNRALNEATAQESLNWNRFITDSTKNSIQILIWASAFSLVGGLKNGKTGLFSPLLRLIGLDYEKK